MRRSAYGLLALLFLTIAGCGINDPATQLDVLDKASASAEAVATWRVGCRVDQVRAERTCWARKSAHAQRDVIEPVPFEVRFVGKLGPVVLAGFNTYPGATPIVRIDSNPPIQDMWSKQLIDEMKSGAVATAEYTQWPDTIPRQLSVDLDGFATAYDELLHRVNAQD